MKEQALKLFKESPDKFKTKRQASKYLNGYGIVYKADRSAVNSVVQGGGADIFRIGLVNLYNKMYKVYPEDFIFQMGVHDELDSLVRRGKEHLIDEMVEILTVRLKGWEIPMVVSVDIGTSWGDLVSFEKEDGIWRPVRC